MGQHNEPTVNGCIAALLVDGWHTVLKHDVLEIKFALRFNVFGVLLLPCFADVDCVVSAWQPWTDCSTDCGPGLQYRSRSIEVYPVANGRSCPSQRENQACQKRLCGRRALMT